jgi:homoserine dehydrogenase
LLTDRDGVYESDPAVANSHPKRFAALNYADARQVAGKLIQPKAVAFLESHQARAEVAALAQPYQSVVYGGQTELGDRVPAPPCHVVILGLGTVGFGVHQRLLATPDQFRVLGAWVRDRAKYQAAGVPPELLHTGRETLRALRPTLVIDALPGVEPSGSLLAAYLAQGIDVVSANKAVMAERGVALARVAQTSGAMLRYAAAVGGSTPMLECLSGAGEWGDHESIAAVLNGTCNFVLDRCAEGAGLEDAVAEAQRCGFAEADPSDDLSGRDAARKLKILARQGFDTDLESVRLEALTESIAQHAQDAARAGMKLRQVARMSTQEGRITAAVEFERVHPESFFGALVGEWNGMEVRYASGKTLTTRGRGAGRWPTTEAVMADIFEVIRSRSCSSVTQPGSGCRPRPMVHSVGRLGPQ